MVGIGYAELNGNQCVVKFADGFQPSSSVAPGFDLNSHPVVRDAVQKAADAGYGFASKTVSLGTNRAIVGLLPIRIKDVRPGSARKIVASIAGCVRTSSRCDFTSNTSFRDNTAEKILRKISRLPVITAICTRARIFPVSIQNPKS
jgi:hypothetical protein